MKKRQKYKYILCLIITIGLIICSLSSCEPVHRKPNTTLIRKPQIAVSILYDGSGTAEGILNLEQTYLFYNLFEYISSGVGGAVRFNYLTDKTKLNKGIEFFITPIYFNATKPIKSDFNSSLMYDDAMSSYKSKVKRFNTVTFPQYDSLCKLKIKRFYDEFEDYKSILGSGSLKHSSQIELSIAQTIPFFTGIDDPFCKKFLFLFTDGRSNSPRSFKLDTESFNALGIRTFIIGLSKEKASGDWMNIKYEESTNYSKIIDKLINNNF